MRPTPRRTRVRVGVINVPIKVRARAWRRCFGLTANRTDIFGVNECLTRKQQLIYVAASRRRGLGQYGTRIGPNPVFWDAAKYHLVSGRQVRLHDGGTSRRARLFPGYNAPRYVTEVVLGTNGRDDEIAVLNTHWVPNGVRVPVSWRRQMRSQSKAHVSALVDKHLAAGRVVYVMGDFNIHRRFSLGAVTWLRGTGVDKVGIAVPRGTEIRARRSYTFPAPTDHRHGVVGIVRLLTRSPS